LKNNLVHVAIGKKIHIANHVQRKSSMLSQVSKHNNYVK